MKKQPPKVHAEVIKKGPPVGTLANSLFSMMETDMKDECKGKFDCYLQVRLLFVDANNDSLQQMGLASVIFLVTMTICQAEVD